MAQRAADGAAALVGLPAAHGGEAGVGGVPLRDAVPDDPDLGREPVDVASLGRRCDLAAARSARVLPRESLALDLENGGVLGALPRPEPPQVQRQVLVAVGGGGVGLRAPGGVRGQVVRRVRPVGTAEGTHQEWTVKKRSLTSPE
jgi:hypothetical protein